MKILGIVAHTLGYGDSSAALAVNGKIIGVVEKRQTMPILSHILFRKKEDLCEVVASDLEVQLSADMSFPLLSPLLQALEGSGVEVDGGGIAKIVGAGPNQAGSKMVVEKDGQQIRHKIIQTQPT